MYSDLSVFDLDHTLLKANCSFRFGSFLYKQNFFPFKTLMHCLISYARHKLFGLSIARLHQAIFKRLFKERGVNEINQYVQLFLDQQLERMLYDPVIQRLKEAQRKGHYTMILSSSPDFLVRPIANRLGVDEWKSSLYSQNEKGCLGSIVDILEGSGKASYVLDLAKRLNGKNIFITAYSDSYLDLPFLSVAGKAIGVVPDRRLRKACIKNGWEIL